MKRQCMGGESVVEIVRPTFLLLIVDVLYRRGWMMKKPIKVLCTKTCPLLSTIIIYTLCSGGKLCNGHAGISMS